MDIGRAIKALRTKRGIRQQRLAKKVGVSQGYLSLIERGDREPGLDFINKVANYLMIPQQLLFLMACDNNVKFRQYKKQMKNIMTALDEILRKV